MRHYLELVFVCVCVCVFFVRVRVRVCVSVSLDEVSCSPFLVLVCTILGVQRSD
jgi:hypothetical protein